MDEILVNFDRERTRAACRAIGEMAATHQVLYFTCHPELAELMLEENPSASLIELK